MTKIEARGRKQEAKEEVTSFCRHLSSSPTACPGGKAEDGYSQEELGVISPGGVTEGNISGQVLGLAPVSRCLVSLLKTAEPSLTSGFWDLLRVIFYFRLVARGDCYTDDSGVESVYTNKQGDGRHFSL